MKKRITDIVPYTIITLSIVWLLLLATRTIVLGTTVGTSMMPTLNGKEFTFTVSDEFVDLQRGDIIVIKNVGDEDFIKRIVGLPGETIEFKSNCVKINGELLDEPYATYEALGKSEREQEIIKNMTIEYKNSVVTLSEDEYFVMGDNRVVSNDSRNFGPVTSKDVLGKVIYYK